MDNELLKKLSVISQEEQDILNNITSGENLLYFENNSNIINKKTLLADGRLLTIRTHRRFIDFPLHSHNFLEMMLVASGNITHVINDKEITLEKGDLLIINKQTYHSIKKCTQNDIGVSFIVSDEFLAQILPALKDTFFQKIIEENLKDFGEQLYLVFNTSAHKELENVCENLIAELTKQKTNNLILTKTVELLFDYLISYPETLRLSIGSYSKTEKQKAAVQDYLNQNYKTATLTQLAKIMFFSAPYLSKWISEGFGKSFNQLLREKRLDKAYALIANSKMSITEIISSIGYENTSFFYSEFKKYYNTTPLQLRKSI